MNIDKQYQIEAVVSSDKTRPEALRAVNIAMYGDQPVAMAGDGFMLAIVPITLDEGDVPGLVPTDHIIAARKKTTKRDQHLVLALGADTTMTLDGTTRPRKVQGTFPDVAKVVKDNTTLREDDAPTGFFALDADLFARLGKALGTTTLTFLQVKKDGAFLVKPAGTMLNGNWTSVPFGLLMPVHVAEALYQKPTLVAQTVAAAPTEQPSEAAA